VSACERVRDPGDLLAVFVLVFFGLVAVGGTYLLQRGTLPSAVLLASIPIGLLATAILMVNNLRDVGRCRRETGAPSTPASLGPPACT
jgi:1,4-dihydroxy-2-naphthoate octaprenyltransferase